MTKPLPAHGAIEAKAILAACDAAARVAARQRPGPPQCIAPARAMPARIARNPVAAE